MDFLVLFHQHFDHLRQCRQLQRSCIHVFGIDTTTTFHTSWQDTGIRGCNDHTAQSMVDLPILTPPDPVNRTSSLVSVASALSQLRRYLIPIRIYRASVLASEWACVSQKRVRWVGWIIRHTGHTIEAISVSVRAYLDPRTWDKEHSTDSHTKNV